MAGGAERSGADQRVGAAQGEATVRKQARPQERASGPASTAGSCAGLGAALRGPRRGGGASDGASCAAPSLGGGAAPGSGALGAGEGVSPAAAERPRTPAGFWGRAEREPQRSAPAPGSCDLAAPGAAPSTRLPISGRGAGLGSRQGAGARWPREGGAWAPVDQDSGGSASPSGDDSGLRAPVAPFPPGPAWPGRALRREGWAGRGAGPTRLAAGPRRPSSAFLRAAEPSRGA